MRLRREEIESLDIAIAGSSIGDLFDVWSKSGTGRCIKPLHERSIVDGRTCDVLVQDGVLFDHVVEHALAVSVDYEDFPLSKRAGLVRLMRCGGLRCRRAYVAFGDVMDGAEDDLE